MRVLKEKNCVKCDVLFQPTGSCAKYCDDCRKERWLLYQRDYSYNWRVKHGTIKNPGVGSGGLIGSGKDNHMYKTGLASVKQRLGPKLRDSLVFCNRCGFDVKNAGKRGYVIHHIDHNQSNNDISNLELLCRKCHGQHHIRLRCLSRFND